MVTSSNIHYDGKSLMTDDYLKVLKFFASDIFQFKLVKATLWLLLFIHGAITIITTYFVLYVLTSHEFITLSPIYFGASYSILAILTLLLKSKLAANLKTDLEMWAIENASKEIQCSLRREMVILQIFATGIVFLGVLGGCLSVPNGSNEKKYYFALRFFDEYCPKYSGLLMCIYKATTPFIGYVMVAHPCQEHIAHVADFETDDQNNDNYQEEVRKRMVFCIERSFEILRLYSIKVGEIQSLLVSFALCGTIVGISVFVTFISGEDFTPEYYPRVVVISIVATLAFASTIWSGQVFETEFENIATTLTIVNWYDFDKDNKDAYLCFLTNFMKVRKIRFSENYSLNYNLGLAVVRWIYSIASVVFRLMRSDK